MPKMIVSIDGVVIKEVQLTKDRTTLGRRPYNDVVIDNLAVSGEHAVIEMGPGGVTLEDLDSTNGTYVNGKAIKRQALQHNDTIEVGKYRIRFLHEAGDTLFEKTMVVRPSAAATVGAPGPAAAPQVSTASPPGPSLGPTQPMSLGPAEARQRVVIKLLSGAAAGREVPLVKPVTTIGKPGVAVASISRGPRGFVVTHVEGERRPLLNGHLIPGEPATLKNGDVLELAGTRMQFIEA